LTGLSKSDEKAALLKEVEDKNRQAIALDPECVPALLYLSVLTRRNGAPEEADASLQRASAIAPNDFGVNFNLALSVLPKNPEQSSAYARRAHLVNPDFRRLMFFLLWRAQEYQLDALADRWLTKIKALTRDVQVRELIECQQLIGKQDYAGALERLRLLPPTLVNEVDSLSVPQMTYDALLGAEKY